MRSGREIVIAHGLWHQPAHFDRLVAALRRHGFVTHVPRLHRGSLDADTTAVQRVVSACEVPPLVLGHSYGGSVVTGLTGAAHLLFVAAFVPSQEESAASLGGEHPLVSPAVAKHVDGSTTIRSHLARAYLYGDCSSADADWATSLLVAQQPGHGRGKPARVSWQTTDSTYVICEDDVALDPRLQERMSRRCATTVRLKSDHSPYISHPDELADIINSASRAMDRRWDGSRQVDRKEAAGSDPVQ
jgi:pimeloyl-ACP methyl ester carboxylesterase